MKLKKICVLLYLAFGSNELNLAAPVVSPSNVPLSSSDASIAVKPNVMFVFDDTVNMSKGYLGDDVVNNNCRSISASNTILPFSVACYLGTTSVGDLYDEQMAIGAPIAAAEINKLAYNPNITYTPGVKSDGTYYANQSLSSAVNEPYLTSGSRPNRNLGSSGSSGFLKDIYFCKVASPTSTQLADNNTCKRNGVDDPNNSSNTSQLGIAFNLANALPNTTYKYRVSGPMIDGTKIVRPTYFKVTAWEYCDNNGVNCSTDSTTYTNPSYVRYCKSTTDAASTSLVSGQTSGVNRCQKNYDTTNGFIYPRYGNFTRYQIGSTEGTNYANWYTYYRTRFLALKTASGMAFKNIDSSKRVGFITINPGNPVGNSNFVGIDDFTQTQKDNFYGTMYSQTIKSGNGSPLREALSRVGRYYAGKTDGINRGISGDPVQYSCQANFSIIATDGYWDNSAQGSYSAGVDLNGSPITNYDNTNSGYASRASGSYDGGLAGSSATLSDVAMYYYQTDLRSDTATNGGQNVGINNVPITLTDSNTQQHMVTYAISLGLSGFLSYTSDYSLGKNTDLENIKRGASGVCTWTNGVCNWPVPTANSNTTIDDLWHATINGRGKYYNAQNASEITVGLTQALSSLVARTASSAAAATSSPNVTSGDNYLFYTTYRTNKWDGEIAGKTIDPISGVISSTALWSARDMLNSSVSSSTDSRNIYYIRNGVGTSELRNFNSGSMSSAELAYFSNACSSNKINCSNTGTLGYTVVNLPSTVIGYLRGQRQYEEQYNTLAPIFRNRDFVLGDIVNSAPVYVGAPKYNWPDISYDSFALANQYRTPQVYAGGNDGMLHAFNATTGAETWAVIPSIHMPNLIKLADKDYPSNHKFYVDGLISVMDVKLNGVWKTILVSGMGAGGKGYIALDVTDPASPSVLWEFCNDSTMCSRSDTDMGLSYGNPIITQRYYDNTWVVYVSAGYDSASGKGIVYELDAATGAVLRKLSTQTGTSSSPAGVAKINTYSDSTVNGIKINTAKYLYAGDLDGNIWKWDLTDASKLNAYQLGNAKDANSIAQPITAKIEIGKINSNPVLFIGTGKYLSVSDLSTTSVQSVYAIKDANTNTNYGVLRNNANIVAQTITSGTTSSTVTSNAVNWSSKIGWYFDLKSQTGERVNVDMNLVLGTLNIVTNVPGSAICTSGGSSWYYQTDYLTGGALPGNNYFLSKKLFGGLSVGQVIVRLASTGVMKNYITDAGGFVTPYGMTMGTSVSSNVITKSSWKEIYKK